MADYSAKDMFDRMEQHYNHAEFGDVVIVRYGSEDLTCNMAIECAHCGSVIFDADNPYIDEPAESLGGAADFGIEWVTPECDHPKVQQGIIGNSEMLYVDVCPECTSKMVHNFMATGEYDGTLPVTVIGYPEVAK